MYITIPNTGVSIALICRSIILLLSTVDKYVDR